MTGLDIQEKIAELVRGLKCTKVELYEPQSWRFEFEKRVGLNVQCPWRIVNEHGIALGSEDHGQPFGLPAPVNGEQVAFELLSASGVKRMTIEDKTGDFSLELESGVQLQVFNNSVGCEGWNCGTFSGLQVIGLGGGSTANSVCQTDWLR